MFSTIFSNHTLIKEIFHIFAYMFSNSSTADLLYVWMCLMKIQFYNWNLTRWCISRFIWALTVVQDRYQLVKLIDSFNYSWKCINLIYLLNFSGFVLFSWLSSAMLSSSFVLILPSPLHIWEINKTFFNLSHMQNHF